VAENGRLGNEEEALRRKGHGNKDDGFRGRGGKGGGGHGGKKWKRSPPPSALFQLFGGRQ
jgi:hypothetical protein